MLASTLLNPSPVSRSLLPGLRAVAAAAGVFIGDSQLDEVHTAVPLVSVGWRFMLPMTQTMGFVQVSDVVPIYAYLSSGVRARGLGKVRHGSRLEEPGMPTSTLVCLFS